MKVIDIRTSAYFSGIIIFLGVVFCFLAIYFIRESIVVSLIFALLAVLIFSTHYRLRIDLEKKEYHDYLWILGMKHGEKGKFDHLQYLFIKKSKVSQTMRLKAASSTVSKEVFDGYLKISQQNSIHLLTKDDKASLLRVMRRISGKLNTPVMDYSSGAPVEV